MSSGSASWGQTCERCTAHLSNADDHIIAPFDFSLYLEINISEQFSILHFFVFSQMDGDNYDVLSFTTASSVFLCDSDPLTTGMYSLLLPTTEEEVKQVREIYFF